MWQCSACSFRTALCSGTMMENSNLTIRTWHLSMAFMTCSKKGILAAELQRQLNHTRYIALYGRLCTEYLRLWANEITYMTLKI